MKLNKGFTLIELLVVIAIIGIPESTMLASLDTAQSNAANASITISTTVDPKDATCG